MNQRAARLALVLVILISAIAHGWYLLASSGDYYFPDSQTYLTPARNLADGQGFINEVRAPETMRTPGYPIFLLFFAPTFDGTVIATVQHLLLVVAGALFFVVVRRETISTPVAAVTTIVWQIDPLTVQYGNKVLSETLFAVLFLPLFFLLYSQRRGPRLLPSLAAGLLCAAAAFVRPVALYFTPLIALWLASVAWKTSKEGRIGRAAYIGVFVLVVGMLPEAAWIERNREETGVATFASIAGTNLLAHRAAPLLVLKRGGDFTTLPKVQDSLVAAADDLLTKQCNCDVTMLPHARRGQVFEQMARPIILREWRFLPQLTWRGAKKILFDTNAEAYVLVSKVDAIAIRRGCDALAIVEFALALIGLIALGVRDRVAMSLLVLTIGYFVVIAAGSEAEARFRMPLLPVILFAAARIKKEGGLIARPLNPESGVK